MKQMQYAPQSIAQMAVVLYAANEGYLNDVEVEKIQSFETGLLSYMASEYSALMSDIVATGKWDDSVEESFKKAIETFKATQTW